VLSFVYKNWLKESKVTSLLATQEIIYEFVIKFIVSFFKSSLKFKEE